MNIYVGNLSFTATENDLEDAFGEYGDVSSVNIIKDRETGRSRGFAFVEMTADAEETAAIEALDGAEWMGRDLKVSKAKPRENNGGGNRRSSYGGGNRDSFSRSGGGGNRWG